MYLYFTGTIPATEYFTENPWPSPFPGYFTFLGLYQGADKVAGLFGRNFLTPEDYASFYAPITTGPFNSTGHLTYYYSDFREPGVLIIPYILGFISAYLFFWLHERPRTLAIELYGIIIAFIIITTRGTMTAGVSIWFTIIILFLQYTFFYLDRGLTRTNNL